MKGLELMTHVGIQLQDVDAEWRTHQREYLIEEYNKMLNSPITELDKAEYEMMKSKSEYEKAKRKWW